MVVCTLAHVHTCTYMHSVYAHAYLHAYADMHTNALVHRKSAYLHWWVKHTKLYWPDPSPDGPCRCVLPGIAVASFFFVFGRLDFA